MLNYIIFDLNIFAGASIFNFIKYTEIQDRSCYLTLISKV